MKNIIREICFGKNSKLTLLLVFSLIISVGLSCKLNKSTSDDADTKDTKTEKSKTTSDSSKDKSSSDDSKSDDSKLSDKANGDAPSDKETDEMVKETMADFADAVDEGDFSDFRKTTSKDFQATYTAEQLNNTFNVFISKKSQVLPSLKDVQDSSATFTDGPRIRTEKGYKILVANGSFSTSPYSVKFETEYEKEGSSWKILKIRVQM